MTLVISSSPLSDGSYDVSLAISNSPFEVRVTKLSSYSFLDKMKPTYYSPTKKSAQVPLEEVGVRFLLSWASDCGSFCSRSFLMKPEWQTLNHILLWIICHWFSPFFPENQVLLNLVPLLVSACRITFLRLYQRGAWVHQFSLYRFVLKALILNHLLCLWLRLHHL